MIKFGMATGLGEGRVCAEVGGEAGTNSLEMYSYGPPHMAVQKQDDQHEHTFSSYVRIRDVVLKTYPGR